MGLKRLFSRRSPVFAAPLAPAEPFFAIGDVHGCATALARLTELLSPASRAVGHIVAVGDYIDRGDDSARVLRALHETQRRRPDRLTCLMGNHEAMLLEFLDRPALAGAHWLRHGGMQTLASFGLAPLPETAPQEDWIALRDALRARLGPMLETWLRGLPLHWQSGNVVVAHAGADPARPIAAQAAQDLVWGHPDFGQVPRSDGLWIVHGHWVVEAPTAQDGRIAIDTGAFATGRLSAARIARGGLDFLST